MRRRAGERSPAPSTVIRFLVGKDEFHFGMGTRDDMHADQFADLLSRGGTGVGGGLDRAHVAADHDGHKSAADLHPSDKRDVGGLDHGIGGFNGAHEALGFNHAQSIGGSHVGLLDVVLR